MTEKDLNEEVKEEACNCGHDHEGHHHHDHEGECGCEHGHEHHHEHEGECGCSHKHQEEAEEVEEIEIDEEEFEDFDIITLTLDDDTELECAVMNIFEVEGQSYIALLPLDGEEEDRDVLLYRFKELEDDEIEINMIETEEEFDKVAEIYYELNEEYDDEEGEDEE